MQRKKQFNTKYSPEFKMFVILDMRSNYLTYRETVRKYWTVSSRSDEDLFKGTLKRWERKYLEMGELGLMQDNRGRQRLDDKKCGRPSK